MRDTRGYKLPKKLFLFDTYQPPFFSMLVLHLGQGLARAEIAFSFSESSPPAFLIFQSLNMLQLNNVSLCAYIRMIY